jgi:DnaJ family protein C protein 7
MSSTSQTTPE